MDPLAIATQEYFPPSRPTETSFAITTTQRSSPQQVFAHSRLIFTPQPSLSLSFLTFPPFTPFHLNPLPKYRLTIFFSFFPKLTISTSSPHNFRSAIHLFISLHSSVNSSASSVASKSVLMLAQHFGQCVSSEHVQIGMRLESQKRRSR